MIEPVNVVYYAAGVPHGLRNVGEETARYLVLEFEAPRVSAAVAERKRKAKAAAKQMAGSAALQPRPSGTF